jgi:predicted metal-binding membrane protein
VDAVRRDRLLIWISVCAVVALAWAYLIHLDRQMAAAMASDAEMARMGMAMDPAPWTATDLWFTFAMWAVMMAGMMAPSAATVLLVFAGAQSKQAGGRAGVTVPAFASGYLAVWTGFSAGAALVQGWLHQHALLSPLMAVLFAVGVMNLIWVAAITGVVLLEKVVPADGWVVRVAGIAMIFAGVILFVRA